MTESLNFARFNFETNINAASNKPLKCIEDIS